ncbi:MAG: AMP-binding protein, partial [Jatrophihabitantaceae bacterium]
MTAAVDPRAMMAELMTRLTGPGAAFELVEQDVCGARMQVLAHRERAVGELLEQSRQYGDADYLVTEDGRLSFTQHLQAVASLSHALSAQHGIGKGDRVAILAANAPEWIVAFWALASLGAITVGFNAWWTTPEVGFAVEHSTPSLIITDAKRAGLLGMADVP